MKNIKEKESNIHRGICEKVRVQGRIPMNQPSRLTWKIDHGN